VFSAKLHIDKNGDMEEVRAKINAELPADQHMFAIFPVGNRFNAKNTTSHRNYSYFLPTFMLKPI
jgi:tRNA U38,U39,U40 pseudouridine synthase TruA